MKIEGNMDNIDDEQWDNSKWDNMLVVVVIQVDPVLHSLPLLLD